MKRTVQHTTKLHPLAPPSLIQTHWTGPWQTLIVAFISQNAICGVTAGIATSSIHEVSTHSQHGGRGARNGRVSPPSLPSSNTHTHTYSHNSAVALFFRNAGILKCYVSFTDSMIKGLKSFFFSLTLQSCPVKGRVKSCQVSSHNRDENSYGGKKNFNRLTPIKLTS